MPIQAHLVALLTRARSRASIVPMIPRIMLPLFLVVGLCCLSLTNADAKHGGKAKPRATPFHVTIESVSADSITVDDPGGAKSYKINKDTEITFQGNDITADQLQVGMRVEVTPDAVDDSLAGVIQADDPPSAAPARK